ncbi:MAG: hypothetical protein VYA91_10175 [Pseudomonadota bacterium]|nr:hypothetical protein [Pseudomonadota bacterium]
MKQQPIVKGVMLVSGAAVLAACGGGGGGGGSSSSALSLDTENYANKQIAISADANVQNLVGLYDGIAEGLALVGEVESTLLPAGAEESATVDCDGGGTLTVSYVENGQGAEQSLTFNACVVTTSSYGAVLLNGGYDAVLTVSGETEASASASYDITGERLTTGEPLQILGSTDIRIVSGSGGNPDNFSLTNTIDAFEIKLGSDYAAITGGDIRITRTESTTEFSIAGKILGSDIGGYVQLSTPAPVVISDTEACPIEGIIRIASDGSAEVRYGSSAGGTAPAVAVWIDGQVVESYPDCSTVGFTNGY